MFHHNWKCPKYFYDKGWRIRQKQAPQRCFIVKGVLRNFVKFTEKLLCQSLFFNKVPGLSPATFIRDRDTVVVIFFRTPSDDCFWIRLKVTASKYVRFPVEMTEHNWWKKLNLTTTQQAHNVYTTLVLGHIYVTSCMNVYTTLLQRL